MIHWHIGWGFLLLLSLVAVEIVSIGIWNMISGILAHHRIAGSRIDGPHELKIRPSRRTSGTLVG